MWTNASKAFHPLTNRAGFGDPTIWIRPELLSWTRFVPEGARVKVMKSLPRAPTRSRCKLKLELNTCPADSTVMPARSERFGEIRWSEASKAFQPPGPSIRHRWNEATPSGTPSRTPASNGRISISRVRPTRSAAGTSMANSVVQPLVVNCTPPPTALMEVKPVAGTTLAGSAPNKESIPKTPSNRGDNRS